MGGINIFYRETGPLDAPVVLLLHGYQSSSRMFEPLFPLLATDYRLIAPDYPGFGLSEAPDREHPDAAVHLLEAGHFAINDRPDDIAQHIRAFLKHTVVRRAVPPAPARGSVPVVVATRHSDVMMS